MTRYNLIFRGQIIEGFALDNVKNNLASLFNVGTTSITSLFSGKPVVIKKNLDTETTKKYLQALKQAGAIVKAEKIVMDVAENKPSEPPDERDSSKQQSPTCSSSGLSAGLASLISYNQHVTEQSANTAAEESEQPDIPEPVTADSNIKKQADDGLTLAGEDPGALTAPETKSVDIPDTSHLSMSVANSGSLEEFAIHKEAMTIPDISHLTVSAANSGSLEEFAQRPEAVELPDISAIKLSEQDGKPLSAGSVKPLAQELPDISGIEVAPPGEGDLSEFRKPVQAVEIPDISHLHTKEPESRHRSDASKANYKID